MTNIADIINKNFGGKDMTGFRWELDPRSAGENPENRHPAMCVFNFGDDRIVFFSILDIPLMEFSLEIAIYAGNETYTFTFEGDKQEKVFHELLEIMQSTGEALYGEEPVQPPEK